MSEETPTLKQNYRVTEREGGLVFTSANYVHLDWTAHDIRVRFCELSVAPIYYALDPAKGIAPDTNSLRMEERVSVSLSWSQAKHLAGALADAVNRFEAKNGTINPPQMP